MQTWEIVSVRQQGHGLLWIVMQVWNQEIACVTVVLELGGVWDMIDNVGRQFGYGD